MFRILIAILISASSLVAHAESNLKNWGVGGGIGQSFPTGPSVFFNAEEQKLHGSIWARHYLSDSFGLELNYQRLNFDGKSGATSANLTGYTLNAVMRCTKYKDSKWSPLTAIGLGLGEITDYGTDKYQELYALLRMGIDYSIIPNLALGAHAQFNYAPETSSKAASEIHSLSYLLALTYNFGGSDSKAAEPAPVAAAPIAAAPQVMDADGDGVADELDKCSDTPQGAKVNAYGCQEKEKAQVRLNLTFPAGKAVIPADQKSQIEEVARFMKEYPQTKVLVEGHTDNTGSEAVNKRLSKNRAEAVRQSLIKDFAIEAARLRSEGFGSTKPVESNDTPEGRTANRRVVATISE